MCPSGAALAIPLGPTNPQLITIAEETLVFRRAGFSPALWLLVPAFSLRNAPPWVTPLASARYERSPTACVFHRRDELSFVRLLNERTNVSGLAGQGRMIQRRVSSPEMPYPAQTGIRRSMLICNYYPRSLRCVRYIQLTTSPR